MALAQGLEYEVASKQNSLNLSIKKSSFFPLKDIDFLKRDSEYYESSLIPNINLVVSEEFTGFLAQLFEYSWRIDYQLSETFELQPFRESTVLFSSPRRQVPNALATVYPFPFVKIYPSGSVELMDQWSIFSWSQDALIHEMTHIYQLSQNSKWQRILWPLLGSFSYGNLILPSWILEGSAVLAESLYGSGGRLFSGLVRAFVFSQIKQDFPLKRLLNSYDDPFSNLEKYLHGAYFFSYLHSQYGIKQTQKLFYESGRFFPLGYYGLSRSLKRTFGKDLKTLFQDYKDYYKGWAKQQKSSLEPALAKSKVYAPMNSDRHSIYFLISNFKSPSQLVVFNKKTGAIKKLEKNLPIGKVFYKGGEYYSSASLRTSSTSVEYSLIMEDFKPIDKYNSQYVMDFYKRKAIAIDTRHSHTKNSLIKDTVFYDSVDSSALADSEGSLYYFKQNKEYRTLYKNKKALIQFKSYFSYPVEVSENAVYFIGATKYGSSLFVYKKDLGLYRLSESDSIVYARHIKDNQFLVSEVTPTHYEYKVVKVKERAEEPFLYQYSFKKADIFFKSGSQQKKAVKSKDFNKKAGLIENHFSSRDFLKEDFFHKNLKFYKPLNRLSFQQFFFYVIPDLSGSYNFSTSFRFLDPLQWNELLISNNLSKSNKLLELSYSYQKYRPTFELSLLYDESQLDLKENEDMIETFKDIGFLDTRDIFYPVGKLLKKRKFLIQRTRALCLSVCYPIHVY